MDNVQCVGVGMSARLTTYGITTSGHGGHTLSLVEVTTHRINALWTLWRMDSVHLTVAHQVTGPGEDLPPYEWTYSIEVGGFDTDTP